MFVLLMVLFSRLHPCAFAQTFNSPPLIPTAFDPVTAATGDFDNDGNPDLVYVDGSGQSLRTLHVLLGRGDGTFSHGQELTLAKGICSFRCTINIADVSGDGKLDLIIGANDGPSGFVAVFLGNGDGTFQDAVTSTISIAGSTFPGISGVIAVGDVNGDGSPDLAIPDGMNNSTYIMLGDKSGKFTQGTSVINELYSREVHFADLNHDGHLDLVTMPGPASGGFTVHIGNGDGTFQFPVLYKIGAGFTGFLVDADGDGQPDIIGEQNLTGTLTQLIFLKGKTDGTFAPVSIIGSLPDKVFLLGVGDFNGDGILDLEVANPNGIGILLGQSGLSFGAMISSLAAGFGGFPPPPSQADFNKDGHLDLALIADGGIVLLPGKGDGSFSNGGAQVYDLGKQIATIAVADFNGDKRPDIAVAVGAAIPRLLLGQKDGTFVLSSDPNTVYNGGPGTLGVGDFNGDGHADLALGTVNNSVTPTVLFGDGQGGFSAPVTVTNGTPYVADFNRDGRSDMIQVTGPSAGACFQSCPIVASLGQPNETFSTVSTTALGIFYPILTAIGDLNGDGIPDLVLTGGDGVLEVWLGQGDGTFSQGASLDLSSFRQIGVGPSGAVVADLDGDGKNDLVLTPMSSFYVSNPQALMVLYGKGDGTFEAPALLPLSHFYNNVIVSDVNQDNKPDLILNDGVGIAVILNLGNRAYSEESHYIAGSGITGLTAVDVNGDGFPDLIAAIPGGTEVVVLVNNPAGVPPAGVLPLASIAIAPEPSDAASSFTATATVTAPKDGSPAPTGTVDFFLDGALTGTIKLTSGIAQFTFAGGSSPGLHTIVAGYSGDQVYSPAFVSGVHTVNPPVYTTQTVLTATPTTVLTSQTVHLSATVSAGGVSPCNGCSWGYITFLDGTRTISAQRTDANGTAIFDTSLLTAGAHTLTAIYHGFKNASEIFTPSTSSPVTETVNSTATFTTANVSSSSVTTGTVVTLSASVSSGAGTPFGGITFFDGTLPLGTMPVGSNGGASFNTASLGVGTHIISATYNANATFAASSSAPVSLIVHTAPSSATPTFTALSPTLHPQDGTLVLQATIAAGKGVPQSTVTFLDAGVVLGRATNNVAGIAVLTVPMPTGATHVLSASFSGDSEFASSVSPELRETWSAINGDFSIAPASTLITFNGTAAETDVSLVATSTLQGPVQLACASNLPTGYVCSFQPASLSQSGISHLSIQRLVMTSRQLIDPNRKLTRGLALAVIALFGMVVFNRRRASALLVLLCCCGLFGCGGHPAQNPTQIQVITLTATSAAGQSQIAHSTQLVFVVPNSPAK